MMDSSSLELSSVVIAVGGHDDDGDDIETGGSDDDVNVSNKNENENPRRIVDFSVGGMTCSMCSSSVLKLLTEMPGITYATVTLATNIAHVEYIESPEYELTAEIIADEIECIGYDINDIMKKKPKQQPKKRNSGSKQNIKDGWIGCGWDDMFDVFKCST